MRPNTSWSGILSTKRKRPVRTSMLTRMLVPNPKKAFQSPGVQMVGRRDLSVTIVIARSRQDGCRDAPASRADLKISFDQPRRRRMSRILFGRFCEQERAIRPHAGLRLETE